MLTLINAIVKTTRTIQIPASSALITGRVGHPTGTILTTPTEPTSLNLKAGQAG